MATQIEKSGVFRDAYRMQIGDGKNDAVKAGLTEGSLSALVAKAQQKWPNSNFEFRLIEKRGATYLEVLRQNQNTLAKDQNKTYKPGQELGPLADRDLRRLKAVQLLSKFISRDASSPGGVQTKALYHARGLAGGVPSLDNQRAFATNQDRGINVGAFFSLIDRELGEHANQRVKVMHDNVPRQQAQVRAQAPQAPANGGAIQQPNILPPIQQPVPLQQPVQAQSVPINVDEELPQFDPDLIIPNAKGKKDAAQWEQAHGLRSRDGVNAQDLKTVREQAATVFAAASKPPAVQPEASVVLLDGGKKALRLSSPDKQAIEYFDRDKLKTFNNKGPYKALSLPEPAKTLFAQAGMSWDSVNLLHDTLQQAERTARKELTGRMPQAAGGAQGDVHLGQLWTSRALQNKLLQSAQEVRLGWTQRLEQAGAGTYANVAHRDARLAPMAAQALIADLVTAEHLIAVTHDPQARKPLLDLHQQLGDKLLAYLGTQAKEGDAATIDTVRQHLQKAREAAQKRGQAGEPGNFAVDVEKIRAKGQARADKAQQRLAEAVQQQVTLSQAREAFQKAKPKLQEAQLDIQARAEVMLERRREPGAAGGSNAVSTMRNALHKIEVPPKDLSNDHDWQEVCAYAEAVNQLREKGRAGFEGYGNDKKIPDEVVAEKFKITGEYDPLVATKIVSTMRQLMESGTAQSSGAPLHVFMPGQARQGAWMQWSPQTIGAANEKPMLVAMSQLIELEFMIAHVNHANPISALQLFNLHQMISDSVSQALKDNVEERGKKIEKWVEGSKKRVAQLHQETHKNLRRPDLLNHDTLNRAQQLQDQLAEQQLLQRLDRAGQRAEQAQKEAEVTVLGPHLDVGVPPRSTEEAFAKLMSEAVDDRTVAAAYLARKLGGPAGESTKAKEQSRDTLAETLAAQLMQATEQQRSRVPPSLRLLAAASPGDHGKRLAAIEGPRLRQALQALPGLNVSEGEERDPFKIFDYGRLVTHDELKKHLADSIDSTRLAVNFLRESGDREDTLIDTKLMGRRFAAAAREHFSNPQESRPLAGVFLVRGNGHWVSLVAERQPDGSVACMAMDTDATGDEATAWIKAVQDALKEPAAQGQAGHGQALGGPITLTRATASLQVNNAPNACGPLQARMLKSLQDRAPESTALQHAQKWIKNDGGLAKDVEARRWQVRAERVALLGAALEEGQTVVRQHQWFADRLQDNFYSYAQDSFREVVNLLGQASNSDEATKLKLHGDISAVLDEVGKRVTAYRKELGGLKLFNDQGEVVDSLRGRSEIPQVEIQQNFWKMLLSQPPGVRAEGLRGFLEVEAALLNSNPRDEYAIAALKDHRSILLRERGHELLEPEQLKAETNQRKEAADKIKSWNNEDSAERQMPDLVQRLLPTFDFKGGAWQPAALTSYLDRFPQRIESAEVLARAASRLAALFDSDPVKQETWRHQAHMLWAELAQNPWSSQELMLEAQAALQARNALPSEQPLEVEDNEANTTVIMKPPGRQLLRTELNTLLQQQGIDLLVPGDDEGEVQIEKSQPQPPGRPNNLGGAMIGGAGAPVAALSSADRKAIRNYKFAALRVANQKKEKGQYVDPKTNKKVKLETYAKAREVALVQSLFDPADVKSKKGFLSGNQGGVTLSALSKRPNLKDSSALHNKPQVLYELAELVALRQLRKGSNDALSVYKRYLEPALGELSRAGLSAEPSLAEAQERLLELITPFIEEHVKPPA